MLSEQEIQDKIDDFLLDNMSSEEKKEFELLLDKEESVAKQFKLQKMMIDEMRYQKEFERIINKPKIVMFSQKQIRIAFMSIAAVFIGILVVNNSIQNALMDNLFYNMYSTPMIETDTRGDNPLEQAASLLEINQPKKAKDILTTVVQENNTTVLVEDVWWYLALIELKLHNKTNSKKYLKKLLGSEKYAKRAEEILNKL